MLRVRLTAIALGAVIGGGLVFACVDTGNLSSSDDGGGGGGDAAESSATTDASDATTPPDAANDAADPSYASVVLADGPIAYFPFDEPSGSVTVRSVVGSFTGSFSRGVTLGTPSAVGKIGSTAASFLPVAGDSDLSLGNNFAFSGTQPFTIEAWLTPGSIDGTSRHVVSKADRDLLSPYYPINGWNLVTGQTALGSTVWLERATAPNVIAKALSPIDVDRTSHVVGVFDGTTLAIYVNAMSAAAKTPQIDSTPLSTTEAFVGSANGGVNGTHAYNGAIDELAIYDKALTIAQISAHYNAGKKK